MKKCPNTHCSYESVCLKCGQVLESCNIQNENNKFIEDKGVAKRVTINPFNPAFHSYLINPDTNYKRNKKIKEMITLCERFVPLSKDDREDIDTQVEKYMQNTKESCHNIKALVASAFYLKCTEKKKFIKLKEFLANLNIKNKYFLKFNEQIKRIVPQNFSPQPHDGFDEIFELLFEKLSHFLNTQKMDQKKFDMITRLYKPPSNFSKTHKNLFFTTFGESNELMSKTKKLIYEKAKSLYEMPEIQFLKNGKSPMNFITAILVSILKFFELRLTKNGFANLFDIPHCTLSRIMKEIEQCLEEKFKEVEEPKYEIREIKREKEPDLMKIEDSPGKSPFKNAESEFEIEKFNTNADSSSKVNGSERKKNRKRRYFLDHIFKNIQNFSQKKIKDERPDKNKNIYRDIFFNPDVENV